MKIRWILTQWPRHENWTNACNDTHLAANKAASFKPLLVTGGPVLALQNDVDPGIGGGARQSSCLEGHCIGCSLSPRVLQEGEE